MLISFKFTGLFVGMAIDVNSCKVSTFDWSFGAHGLMSFRFLGGLLLILLRNELSSFELSLPCKSLAICSQALMLIHKNIERIIHL